MDIAKMIQEMDTVCMSATKVPGLRGKAMVDVERLASLAKLMLNSLPADIQEAQEIIKQKESILNQTQLEVNRIKDITDQEAVSLKAASEQKQRDLVDDSEIVKVAEAKAEEIHQQSISEGKKIVEEAQKRSYRIVDEAEMASSARREGADRYARETLFDLEERLAGLLGQVRKGIDALGIESETVVQNGNGASLTS
jgi:hypothetical protein